MNAENFFQTRKPQSEIKSKIVSNYFWIWAKVIPGYMKKQGNVGKMCYVDLFAGPGRYEDGSRSTPLLIMEKAINDRVISEHLHAIFNDENKGFIDSLETEINNLPRIETLKYTPTFFNQSVENMDAKEIFPFFPKKVPPTLLFADPFGYKGLSPSLLSISRCWGCDVIFFFNFHQVNRALENPVMVGNMNELFGLKYSELLRKEIAVNKKGLTPQEREQLIIETMGYALLEQIPNAQPLLTFKFLDPKAGKTNHYLVFLTTNQFAFSKMKEVMSKISREDGSTVGTFKFDPKTASSTKHQQLSLFDPENELDILKKHLLKKFEGQEISVKVLFYQDQNLNTQFTEQNYKDALRELEAEEKIIIFPPKEERKTFKGKISMPDNAKIFFVKHFV